MSKQEVQNIVVFDPKRGGIITSTMAVVDQQEPPEQEVSTEFDVKSYLQLADLNLQRLFDAIIHFSALSGIDKGYTDEEGNPRIPTKKEMMEETKGVDFLSVGLNKIVRRYFAERGVSWSWSIYSLCGLIKNLLDVMAQLTQMSKEEVVKSLENSLQSLCEEGLSEDSPEYQAVLKSLEGIKEAE